MSYPSKEELKASLQKVCQSEALCESLSSSFGGQKVNCDHRVPEMTVFKAQKDTKASDQDAESAANYLCSIVDSVGCRVVKK